MEYTPVWGYFRITGGIKHENWRLAASRDGVGIDFETVIESEAEPDFWTCYDLAAANNCEFFTVEEV